MADYSISAFIRDDKPIKRNNKYPIYLRVRVYDRETKLPTNLDVAPSDWNAKKKSQRNEPSDWLLFQRCWLWKHF